MATALIQSEFNVSTLEEKTLATSVCIEGSVVRLAKKSSFGNFSMSCGMRKVKQGQATFWLFFIISHDTVCQSITEASKFQSPESKCLSLLHSKKRGTCSEKQFGRNE